MRERVPMSGFPLTLLIYTELMPMGRLVDTRSTGTLVFHIVKVCVRELLSVDKFEHTIIIHANITLTPTLTVAVPKDCITVKMSFNDDMG